MKGTVAVETFGRADMPVQPGQATRTNPAAQEISFVNVPDSTSSH